MALQPDNAHLVPAEDHDTCSDSGVFHTASSGSGDAEHKHISSQSMEIDTSSLSFPRGSVEFDADGDVYTISRGGSVQLALSDGLDRCTPWQYTSAESMGDFATSPSMEEYAQFIGLEETALIQAVVFIEDAHKYRSINHKVDESCLRLYRHYHSTSVHVFRWVVIFILHMLAFFELPSSLSWTADIRYRGDRIHIPCWLTELIELMCLLLLLADNVIRGFLLGKYYFVRHKWDVGGVLLLLVSLIDWAVSAGFGCTEVVRFRRILRPYFILQNSSLMKKIVNCLRLTLPEVFSVLIMLCMHLYIFTLFGMLLFPVPQSSDVEKRNHTRHSPAPIGDSPSNITASPIEPNDKEGKQYFSSLLDSFMSLLVLLTTANNPDVTMPAYNRNRLFSIFFIIFLIIGLYCFWNMLTAVIYNQFRGYFLSSMQSSLNRRRIGVRAAFEVLRRKKSLSRPESTMAIVGGDDDGFGINRSDGVGGFVIKSVVEQTILPKPFKDTLIEKVNEHPEMVYSSKDFQHLFLELDMEIKPPTEVEVRWCEHPVSRRIQRVIVHKYFSYFGIFVAFCNVIVITVELATEFAESFDDSTSDLRAANFAFANYYVLEQLLKLWANGPRRYIHSKANIFDALITLALAAGEMYSAIKFGVPFFYDKHDKGSITTLWNVLRIINILIMVRLLKIIPHFRVRPHMSDTSNGDFHLPIQPPPFSSQSDGLVTLVTVATVETVFYDGEPSDERLLS